MQDKFGKHVIQTVNYEGEPITEKGIHFSLDSLREVVNTSPDDIKFVVAWKRINGKTRRIRWTKKTGWEKLS